MWSVAMAMLGQLNGNTHKRGIIVIGDKNEVLAAVHRVSFHAITGFYVSSRRSSWQGMDLIWRWKSKTKHRLISFHDGLVPIRWKRSPRTGQIFCKFLQRSTRPRNVPPSEGRSKLSIPVPFLLVAIMECNQARQRNINVDNVVDVALDESTKITLPALRSRSPHTAVRIVAIVRDCDYRVELEAHGLDEVIIGCGIGVPSWAQYNLNTSEKVGNTARFNQFAADKH